MGTIQPNAIRTGNYFLYWMEGDKWEPTQLDWQDIKWCDEENTSFNDVHKEMLVNEEVLYQLGATKFPSGNMLSLCDRLLDYMECRDVWIDAQTSVELKHVHQLQNFFHATKGVELVLKAGGEKV